MAGWVLWCGQLCVRRGSRAEGGGASSLVKVSEWGFWFAVLLGLGPAVLEGSEVLRCVL